MLWFPLVSSPKHSTVGTRDLGNEDSQTQHKQNVETLILRAVIEVKEILLFPSMMEQEQGILIDEDGQKKGRGLNGVGRADQRKII